MTADLPALLQRAVQARILRAIRDGDRLQWWDGEGAPRFNAPSNTDWVDRGAVNLLVVDGLVREDRATDGAYYAYALMPAGLSALAQHEAQA